MVALLATGMLIGVIMVATPASALTNWSNVWNNHIKPKADKRYVNEKELVWAVVNDDGTLDRGNGVASTNRSNTGWYQVRFDQNVRDCVYVASIGLSGASGTENPGEITVVGEALSANGVFLTTHDSTGAYADRSFHLIVDCATTSSPSLVDDAADSGDGDGGDGPNSGG